MEGEESYRVSEDMLLENRVSKQELDNVVQNIRLLSMQLQRYKPQDWNDFLTVALDS